MAKKGTTILQSNHNKVSFHSAKLIIEKTVNKNIQEQIHSESATKQWNCILNNKCLIPDAPRITAVALFRLYTGHDCLAAHLHRLNIYSSPSCVLCNEPNSTMDRRHLLQCSALGNELDLTSRYWDARWQMEVLQQAMH